jgi:hypothetical protein
MHWFWRAALAFVITFLLWLALHGLAWSMLRWTSDVKLADAILGLPAATAFFLLFRYLPALVGTDSPPALHRERPRWFSGWWWKWSCLVLSSVLVCMNDIARAVSAWDLHNKIIPGAEGGFPSAMTGQARRMWIDIESHWHLQIPVTVLGWLALYLFWREGCCRQCGYDLTGNVSGVCPECGERIEEKA